MGMSVTIGLALGFLSTAHAQSMDRIEGPAPAEVSAFQDARQRFSDRAAEMREDTRTFVDLREQEERVRVAGGYNARLDSIGELERNQRELAVERFNDFLQKYPTSDYSSHVRFRLADLYFEIENERWLAASRSYYKRLGDPDLSLEDAEVLETEGPPKLDLSRPISLYKRIVSDNAGLPEEERYEKLDGVFLMLGFCYSEPNSSLPPADYPPEPPKFDPTSFDDVLARKTALAKQAFRDLIAKVPKSDLADRAHLFLGNFLFDEGGYAEAIGEYRLVYDRGEEGKYFDESIYQLAWANYKVDNYVAAVPLFTQVLDRSEIQKAATGKDSDFRGDAVKYLAFSFLDQGEANGDALAVAKRYFTTTGPREYEWEVYVEMGEGLIRYSRLEEAAGLYEFLQDEPRWVHRPENPEFQMQVVRLYGNTTQLNDLPRSGEERLALTARYNDGGEWWEANRNNPEALAIARGYIESSLGQVANELRVRAQETGEQEDYVVAAAKYQEYLDKFPISDDYYEVEWLLADSLRRAGKVREALAEYEALIKAKDYHPFGDGSLYARMLLRSQLLGPEATGGARPADAVVEKTYTTEAGKEIKVYELEKDTASFIAAADAVLQHTFSEPQPGYPDMRPDIEANRHALMYIMGQTQFHHNRFDEARPRLQAVIDQYPRKDEASFAANLLLESYIAEGDLDEVRKLSNRFSTMVLGTADVPDPEGTFRNTLEATAFTQAQDLAKSEDSLAAAEAFMSFLKEFPTSQHKEFSLYNAAFYYQQAGRAERANELYEEFLKKYPDHEFAEKLYFRIAALYESTLELPKAVEYYNAMYTKFPKNENAPDSLYNSANLQIGLGKPRLAAAGLEKYGTTYPDRDDAEKVYFRAGEQWEAVSPTDALSFYDRYLKKYGTETNPNNALTAMAKRAEIYRAKGDTRRYEAELDRIEATFDDLVAKGKPIGPRGNEYAARSAYRSLKKDFDDYAKVKLTRNEDKDMKILFEEVPPQVQAIQTKAGNFAAKYDNFEYSSAALLLHAKVPLVYADLGKSMKPPKGLSEDQEYAYYDILEEKIFPQFLVPENEGLDRLKKLIEKAESLKRHSPSIDAARRELNARIPSEWPDVKPEIPGETASVAPLPIKPVKMRAEETEK